MNHYDKDRDNAALGKWYTDHVSAMTREGLHAKSDIASELAFRDQRIATLEAEKEARERQEPVAWAWNDPAGWIHIQETRERPEWISDEIANGMKLRPLYAHPLALREPTEGEYSKIAIEAGHRLKTEAARIAIGRAMWQAVREVMTK